MIDFSNDTQLQEFIAEKHKALVEGKISQVEFNTAIRDAKAGVQNYSSNVSAAAAKLRGGILNSIGKMTEGEAGVSVYNDAINLAADLGVEALLKLNPLTAALAITGLAVAKYVTSVNKQADALFGAYREISRYGTALGATDTFANLQKFGYTIEEIGRMSQLLQQNSQILAQFGGTAYLGAQKFADLANDIQYSGVGIELQRMGMSVDNINQDAAGYMSILEASGRLRSTTVGNLKDSTVNYINEQTRLTRLTGETADRQNKILKDAYNDPQFAATQYLLDKTNTAISKATRQFNENIVVRFGAEFGEAQGSALAKYRSKSTNNEETIKIRRTYKEATALMDAGIEDENLVMDAAYRDIGQTTKNYSFLGSQELSSQWITRVQDLYKVDGKQYQQSSVERNKTVLDDIAKAKSGADKTVAAQIKFNTATRNMGQSFDNFYHKGIVPVTGFFNKLSGGLSKATGVVSNVAGRTEEIGKGPGTPAAPAVASEGLLRFTANSGSKANFDQLQPSVRNAFMSMIAEYGKSVTIESAARSYEDQARLYNAWVAAGGSARNPIVNVPGMGRIRMPAKPGGSSHESGRALDLDLGSYSGLSGLFGKYGFRTIKGDPGHIQMANGGIATGPKAGYDATLHGTEAVIPMENKKTITVQTKEDIMIDQQSNLISMKITKLDELIRGMQTHYDTSNKILMRQS